MMRLIILLLFGFIFAAAITYGQESAHDRLFSRLMSRYWKSVKPGSPSDTTRVEFSLSVMCAERDRGNLKTYAWPYMTWTDGRLRWNSDEFESATVLNIPSEHLWIPDIVVYNKRDFKQDKVRAVISSDGQVTVVFPVVITTSADVASNSTIIAQYTFGSWTYDGFQVDLVERSNGGVDLSNYRHDANCYQVVYQESRKNVKYYLGLEQPYVDITITLHLTTTAA